MTKPLVSIITPCYNGEAFLKRYFESILNQTYPNLELIFINDGSTDRTEEIALSYRERLEKRGITYIYEKQENIREKRRERRQRSLEKEIVVDEIWEEEEDDD